MEYFEAGSLRQWLQEASPTAAQKRGVLRQILLAIACLHSHGVVHSDIKGENVLIADDGTPRLCDFEMSRDLATMSGGGFTPGFVCPRVLTGAATLSTASDMYAFGVVILNTIRPPRQDEQYPLKEVAAIRSEPAVAGMVERLLAEDPSARPSAVELQAEPYFVSESVDEWGRVDVGDRRSEKRCREELLGADADALGVPEIANVVAKAIG